MVFYWTLFFPTLRGLNLPPFFLTLSSCGDDIPKLYQDLTIEQWESLESLPKHLY
jgi:hypothetical protein